MRHLTFKREMGTSGKYLTHRIIGNIFAPAVHLAKDVTAFLEEHNIVNTVKAFLVDNAEKD